jgi:ABC-type branched-subunit amino acid transport system ATPase component
VSWANQELGIAVLVVEQHISLGLAITTRAYAMVRGRIALEAHSADLVDGRLLEETYLGAGTAAVPTL